MIPCNVQLNLQFFLNKSYFKQFGVYSSQTDRRQNFRYTHAGCQINHLSFICKRSAPFETFHSASYFFVTVLQRRFNFCCYELLLLCPHVLASCRRDTDAPPSSFVCICGVQTVRERERELWLCVCKVLQGCWLFDSLMAP